MGLSQECKVSLTFKNKCNPLHLFFGGGGGQAEKSPSRAVSEETS